MRRGIAVSVLLVCLTLTAGCGYIFYTSGPYQGKVVDAETKAPIEGAAVLAVWYKTIYAVLGGTSAFHAAEETLTDANGEFTIGWSLGLSLNPFTAVREPEFLIFKPGYGHFPRYFTRMTGNTQQVFQGEGTVVELPKLKTREERLQKFVSLPVLVPLEKMPHLLRLRDIERSEIGLKP